MPFLTYLYQALHSAPSKNGPGEYAQLCYWKNGPGASAGIVGLRLVRESKNDEDEDSTEEVYIQFHPKSMKGVADRNFSDLMTGQPGEFIDSFEDACLIEGLRRSSELFTDEDSSITFDEFKLMGDGEKLDWARDNLSEHKQNELIKLGKPTHQIGMISLDLNAMEEMIYRIKNENPKFAPFVGTLLRQSNTENCASVIARVLQAGGADKIAPPANDEITLEVACLSVLMGLTSQYGMTELGLFTLICTLAWRFVGGMIEGWGSANAIGNLMHKEHKPYATPVSWGLHVADTLVSGVVGALSVGSPTQKFLVLPEMLLEQAQRIHNVDAEAGRKFIRENYCRI